MKTKRNSVSFNANIVATVTIIIDKKGGNRINNINKRRKVVVTSASGRKLLHLSIHHHAHRPALGKGKSCPSIIKILTQIGCMSKMH